MNGRCTNCGAELFEGQQFCRPLPAAAEPHATKKRRPWLVPLIAALLLVACVGAAGVVFLLNVDRARNVAAGLRSAAKPGEGFLDEAGAVVTSDEKASVVNGKIEVEDGLGFQPQKKQVGWSLDARLGEGGEPLNVKSVNGRISFEK